MNAERDHHKGAAYNVEEQREILGEQYNDYCAFCRGRGSEPMTLLEFIEQLLRARDICPGCGHESINMIEAEPVCDECGWSE